MKLNVFSAALLALGLAPLAAACSGSEASEGGAPPADDVSVDEANAARVTPGAFKLYGEPRAKPNGSCDVHTRLSLTADGASKAHLEEAVGGICELYVAPNPREYRLRAAGTECGSRIFTGSVRAGDKRSSIRITDNRKRTCEDVIPALIVLEETIDGQTTTKYSHDAVEPAAPCVKTGCSGQICAEGERFSRCDWRAEYSCYRQAVCERQADGTCGFTKTAQLQACLGEP